MDTRTKTIILWSGVVILVIGGIFMLVLSFGGTRNLDENEVNAIYTNAALTIAVQQQTLQAGMITPSPIASITPIPSPTFQMLTPVLLPTISSPAVAPAPASCDGAVYVNDVTIPDSTTIPAGQSFTKTWKVSNTGTCAWTATYQLVFVAGDSLGGKATPIGIAVSPGQSADISVVLTSSSAAGEIKGTWRLSNDKGQTFGDGFTVVINSGTTGAGSATDEPVATDVPTDVPVATDPPTSP